MHTSSPVDEMPDTPAPLALDWSARPRTNFADSGPISLRAELVPGGRELHLTLHLAALDTCGLAGARRAELDAAMRQAIIDAVEGHTAYPRYRRLRQQLLAAEQAQLDTAARVRDLEHARADLADTPEHGDLGRRLVRADADLAEARQAAEQARAELAGLRPLYERARAELEAAAPALAAEGVEAARQAERDRLDALVGQLLAQMGDTLTDIVQCHEAQKARLFDGDISRVVRALLDDAGG
jgi:hypothetical protein